MEALLVLQVMVLKVGILIQSFYYKRGGGPLFDMGPYYLTSLIKIFGNVEKVISYSQKTFDTRKVENPDVDYNEIKVDIDTHYFGFIKV